MAKFREFSLRKFVGEKRSKRKLAYIMVASLHRDDATTTNELRYFTE